MNGEPLTYDELFDTVVREKSQEELQTLALDFFERVRVYLSAKQSAVHTSSTDPFSLQKKEKAMQQMKSIKRVLQDLYERRERKIVNLALIKVRTNSSALDLGPLSTDERLLFDDIVATLNKIRAVTLNLLIDQPVYEPLKKVVFVRDIGTFVGKDMKAHGPFKENDIGAFPASLADILIQQGNAKQA